MFNRPIILASIVVALNGPLLAETWVRGALALHSISGDVVLSELGGSVVSRDEVDLPLSMSALVECEASHGSWAFFSASNLTYLLFNGEGSFGVERFEQLLPEDGAWPPKDGMAGQSRMILNFREGRIAIDSRQMTEASQFLVETPLGRVSAQRALWQMRIEYEPRSRIFDFTITCSDGRLRFTNLQGEQYTLRSGQRLSGAGSRMTPSIEVGSSSQREIEQNERFRKKIAAHGPTAADWAAYRVHFQGITKLEPREASGTGAPRAGRSRRPIIIEHAKDPPAVTPFRAEIRAPSTFPADSG